MLLDNGLGLRENPLCNLDAQVSTQNGSTPLIF
jgi:hypothetical protein